ncbi:MAG: tyrosine-type recombinase/integrase [Bryobacterales bacterium]|nr:tyrosine-type recombinase/integrase [Bryobacterales bacterium]
MNDFEAPVPEGQRTGITALARQQPDWERVKALVLDALSSPHSRRVYGKALDEFQSWAAQGAPEGFTKAAVQRYRLYLETLELAASTINVRLTAVRKLAMEAADNGLLGRDLASGIARVKGAPQIGKRLGNSLSREQALELLNDCVDDSLKGLRDKALLCLLVGCGLRRSEVACLTVEHIQQREGRWVIIDLIGKRGRVRSVPMPAWAKVAIDRWTTEARISEGALFRAVDQTGCVAGQAMTAQAIFLIVRHYADRMGASFAPHDLRRTFAKLAHSGGVPLEQIQLSLGHDSILTTEKYLGVRQNLTDAPCDHLGIQCDAYK